MAATWRGGRLWGMAGDEPRRARRALRRVASQTVEFARATKDADDSYADRHGNERFARDSSVTAPPESSDTSPLVFVRVRTCGPAVATGDNGRAAGAEHRAGSVRRAAPVHLAPPERRTGCESEPPSYFSPTSVRVKW